MKLTLKFIFISAAVLVTGFNMYKAKAQSVKCFDVSSRTGWQYFDLGGPYTRIASVSGGWSVDARSYAPVGPQGHNEPGLEPYNHRTYARTLYIAYPIPRLEGFLTLPLARKSPELLLDFIFFLFFIRFFFWMEGT